jgi:hypothetical protein
MHVKPFLDPLNLDEIGVTEFFLQKFIVLALPFDAADFRLPGVREDEMNVIVQAQDLQGFPLGGVEPESAAVGTAVEVKFRAMADFGSGEQSATLGAEFGLDRIHGRSRGGGRGMC